MTAGIPADPFVRGCAWSGTDDFPYPRADPADLDRLPGDTVASARLPVGVRLELVGDAEVVELDYETRTDDFGYRGEGAGTGFTVVHAGEAVADLPARLGPGTARLDLEALTTRRSEEPVLVYLPEGMRPIVRAVARVRRHDRTRARAAPLARVRRLDRGGVDRFRTGRRVARGGGAALRPRRGEPRIRRIRPGRDPVGRAARRARRRRHLDLARHQLLEPHPVLDRDVPRPDRGVPRPGARRSSRHPDRGDQPDPAPRRRGHTQPARRDAHRPARRDGGRRGRAHRATGTRRSRSSPAAI